MFHYFVALNGEMRVNSIKKESMYYKEEYANLFQKVTWGKIESKFIMEIPNESLIANVNIVPFINNECVVIRLESGEWEIPGGTLEKDEDYHDTIRRELIEEAEAILHTYEPFGAATIQQLVVAEGLLNNEFPVTPMFVFSVIHYNDMVLLV